MTEILMSIKPRFADAIFSGRKTIELRRKIGKAFHPEIKIIIYSSSPIKKIVGEATIEKIEYGNVEAKKQHFCENAIVTEVEYDEYFEGCTIAYGIKLKDIKPYKNPISLLKMREAGLIPPQSYRYISSIVTKTLGI